MVRQIERVGSRNLLFPDATLTADPAQARALFEALIPLKVRWLGQVSLNAAESPSLLDLMAQSGCWLASVGLESVNQASITGAGKLQNRVDGYARLIDQFHQRNIAVEGNLVFGFDDDREDTFERTARFVIEAGVDLPEFYVLTPYPDTPLYHRLCREGRIADTDWAHYDNAHFDHLPVFEPKHMSREQLREGILSVERRVFRWPDTLRRLGRARTASVPVWIANCVFASRMSKHHTLSPSADCGGQSVP